jgi:structural maintenance of chromosome 3 (chondroitin sulfate proteoglycan 6)
MARMTAAQRLELLKEVGGSTVYEERRNESQKVLEDTQRRRIQVLVTTLGGGR